MWSVGRCAQCGGVVSGEVWSMWGGGGGGKWGYVDTNTSAGVKGDKWKVYI